MASTSRIPTKIHKKVSVKSDPSIESIRASLTALGAPEITVDEFARLYKGPLGNALLFLSQHLKGRNGAKTARKQIQQYLEKGSVAHRPDTTDFERILTETRKTQARHSAAEQTLEDLRQQLDASVMKLETLQERQTRIRGDIDRNTRLELLLSALDSKERIREKRFQEITQLLRASRQAIEALKQKNTTLAFDQTEFSIEIPKRATYTDDALANLHAHHIHLVSLAKRASPEGNTEKRLKGLIARSISKPETDPRVSSLFEKCTAIAWNRAQLATQYRHLQDVPYTDPTLVAESVRRKEQELQILSDSFATRIFLCERLIELTAVFDDSPLDEPQVQGYTEYLRKAILDSSVKNGHVTFENDVKRVLSLHGNMTQGAIVEEVSRIIRDAHRRDVFLGRVSLAEPPRLDRSLVEAHTENEIRADERAEALLRRKLEKAALGDELVKETERLLGEVGSIASWG